VVADNPNVPRGWPVFTLVLRVLMEAGGVRHADLGVLPGGVDRRPPPSQMRVTARSTGSACSSVLTLGPIVLMMLW